jgi:hypothetical protein
MEKRQPTPKEIEPGGLVHRCIFCRHYDFMIRYCHWFYVTVPDLKIDLQQDCKKYECKIDYIGVKK